MQLSLYDGDLLVEFDPEKHKYLVNGELWPSVTQALDAIDLGKSGAFAWWSANEYRDHLYANWPLDPETLQPRYVSPSEAVKLIEDGRKQHAKKKDRSADVGTRVHEWIEGHVLASLRFGESPPLPEDAPARNACLAHLKREREHNILYQSIERIVASREHRYIGTMDISSVVHQDGRLGITDNKTSSGMRITYRAQLSAYAMAWNEEHPDNPIWYRDVCILSTDSDDYDLIDLRYDGMTDEESTRLDFEAYLHALWLHREWAPVALGAQPKRQRETFVPEPMWARAPFKEYSKRKR